MCTILQVHGFIQIMCSYINQIVNIIMNIENILNWFKHVFKYFTTIVCSIKCLKVYYNSICLILHHF